MEKERQTRIIAIIALFFGVATLTLGFAAFSANLIIQSKATVRVDSDTFKVILSKEQDKETIGTIKPSGDGDEATISNTGTPTISNLKANFVNPGERVEYEFYAVNLGEFDAYLNKIEYETITSSIENKVCTAEEGTTDAYVQSACNSIRVTVKVAEDDKACQTSTYRAHKLDKGAGEKVLITIEYASTGARADGPFYVEFGDITLNYSTTDLEAKDVSTCTPYDTQIISPFYTEDKTNIEDLDNDGKISLSDKITLGTESFYVMSTNERAGTVTMLAEWNLNIGTNPATGEPGMQNEACKGYAYPDESYFCTTAFSSTNYWGSISAYPTWIYNENNDIIRSIVETYVNNLKSAGYNSVTGRLIQYEELVALGCQADGDERECYDAPPWVKNTSFWTGSAYISPDVWIVSTDGNFSYDKYTNARHYGIRPVITISATEI